MIRKNDWNLNFSRQHPLSIYIADFYCHKIKLVIELDGEYHEKMEVKINDASREKYISEFGIKVLRFKNDAVIDTIETVLTKISDTITSIQIAKMEKAGSKGISNRTTGEEAGSSKTSPLGAGGETGSLKSSPLDAGGHTGSSKTSLDQFPDPLFGGAGEMDKPLPSLFIIKIGGNIIDDDTALQSFLKDFASVNDRKILVHGGGKIASKIGEQLGISSSYINGRRITDEATIDLVTMVYGGLVNKKIVAKLQALDCNAIGLTGADANIIPALKRPVKEINYGFAGDIKTDCLGVQSLEVLLSNNFTPVFAPLTHDGKGQMLNTNADTIAAALAVGLSKNYQVRLIYCFEKKGVLENMEDENSVIPLITKEKYGQLLRDKKLFEGILPKIDNAFAAISNGVKEVLIGDANDLLQNVSGNSFGTLIK
ncbi:MAG: acetylglutamate kinase [Ferruginibacter sp.]|nr:acetylglutamate kinase [Ferruginibacter sp.]